MNRDLSCYKNQIDQYLSKQPFYLSNYAYASLFAWKDFYRFECEVISNSLCIFAHDAMGCFQWLPPLGGNVTKDIVAQCFDYMIKHNNDIGISRIENFPYPSDFGAQYQWDFKNYEYCHFKQYLMEFKGNRFKSKRAAYNQCASNYAPRVEIYHKSMLNGCLELYQKWASNRMECSQDSIYRSMIEENKHVHERMLQCSDELDMLGVVAKVKDNIVAYTFGYPLSNQCFCIILETTDLAYKGMSAFIFREFCRHPALKEYLFINVMDDSDIQN